MRTVRKTNPGLLRAKDLIAKPLTQRELLHTDVDIDRSPEHTIYYESDEDNINLHDDNCSDCSSEDMSTASTSIRSNKSISKKSPTTFFDAKHNRIDTKKKFRRFVFTWNNYPSDYEDKLKALNASYLIAGREVAPTTGTKHL
jgi:hypothetical protein